MKVPAAGQFNIASIVFNNMNHKKYLMTEILAEAVLVFCCYFKHMKSKKIKIVRICGFLLCNSYIIISIIQLNTCNFSQTSHDMYLINAVRFKDLILTVFTSSYSHFYMTVKLNLVDFYIYTMLFYLSRDKRKQVEALLHKK